MIYSCAMRAIIVTAAVALLVLAGCEEVVEKPATSRAEPEQPEPDTAPSFAGTVADRSYTAGEAIASLTLPSAVGGNGSLTYSLHSRLD